MLNIGLIGAGYWGAVHARTIASTAGAHLACCSDLRGEARETILQAYPGTYVTADFRELLESNRCDAIVVAAPTALHREIASEVIRRGKPVLVEKPLAATHADALALCDLAARHEVVAMVGNTYLFNPSFRTLAALVRSGELGTIRTMRFRRIAQSPLRDDVDALWDLAPHDVAMALALANEAPDSVVARGTAYVRPGRADSVFSTLCFPSGIVAHIDVSWDYPEKIRDVSVVGDRAIAIFDDAASERKLRVYRRGAAVPAPGFRDLERSEPEVASIEPLRAQLLAFVDAVRRGTSLESTLAEGARGVRVLEDLTASLRSDGRGLGARQLDEPGLAHGR